MNVKPDRAYHSIVGAEMGELRAQMVAELTATMTREGLASDDADAERQLRLLREEQGKVRQEKTFNRENDDAILKAVCA